MKNIQHWKMFELVCKPSVIYLWFIVLLGSFFRLSRDWYDWYCWYGWCAIDVG